MEGQATNNIATYHEHRAGSSQIQEDPWKSKIILTLDGGGVRGYGSLLMLQVLMCEIARIEREHQDRHNSSFDPYDKPPSLRGRSLTDPNGSFSNRMERPRTNTNKSMQSLPAREKSPADSSLKPSFADFLPCHYFDYIGGTSTGGLNAIMLGRLRMSADQCVINYPSLASEIFSKPRLQFKGWPRNKYDARVLEDAIERLVQLRTDGKKGHLATFASPDDLCRTFVIAKKMLDGNGEDPYIFRSYRNHGTPVSRPINHGEASKDQIWEIGRATAAAPTYFKPQKIGEDFYSDGGLGYNNPAEEAYHEVLLKEGYSRSVPISLFLSIGTGGDDDNDHLNEHTGSLSNYQAENAATPGPELLTNKNKKKKRKKSFFLKHLSNLGERLQKEVVEAKKVDRHMRGLSHHQNWGYVRWTGGRDLAKLKLDKWDAAKLNKPGTQCDIENWVRKYMESPARQDDIRQIAETVVRVRRQRIAYDNGDRWQRFTYCSAFRCPFCLKETLYTRAQLAEHVEECNPGGRDSTARYLSTRPQVNGGPW